MIAVSFNVGGGVYFITAAKLYMYTLPTLAVIYFKAQNFLETTALDKVCYIDTKRISIWILFLESGVYRYIAVFFASFQKNAFIASFKITDVFQE